MRFLWSSVFALTVSGCAAVPVATNFAKPGEPTAIIEIRTTSAAGSTVIPFEDAEECRKMLLTGMAHPGAPWTLTAPAGREVALEIIELDGSVYRYCQMVVSFTPEADQHYVFTDSLLDRTHCGVALTRISADGKQTPEPFDGREYRTPVLNNGPRCTSARTRIAVEG